MGDLTRGVTYAAAGEVTNTNLHALVDDGIVKSGVITTDHLHASNFEIDSTKLKSDATSSGRAVDTDHVKDNAIEVKHLEVTNATEMTSGVDGAADKIYIYDNSDSAMKVVKPDNLGLTANGMDLSGAGTKSALVDADRIPFQDTEASDVTKVITRGNFNALASKLDATGLTAKTTLVDADHVLIFDSAASDVPKKVTIPNLNAVAKRLLFRGFYLPDSVRVWGSAPLVDTNYGTAVPTADATTDRIAVNATNYPNWNDDFPEAMVVSFYPTSPTSTPTIPGGLSAQTKYFARDIVVGATINFKIYTAATGGSPINITSETVSLLEIAKGPAIKKSTGDTFSIIRLSSRGDYQISWLTAFADTDYHVIPYADEVLPYYSDDQGNANYPSDGYSVGANCIIRSKTTTSLLLRTARGEYNETYDGRNISLLFLT